MKISDSFSIPRLAGTIKHDLQENRSVYTGYIVTTFAGLLLFYIIISLYPNTTGIWRAYQAGEQIWPHCCKNLSLITIYIGAVFILTAASQFLGCISTKNERMRYTMLPASSTEKLLSRIIIFCVILPATLPFIIMLAEGARLAIQPLLGTHEELRCSFIPELLGGPLSSEIWHTALHYGIIAAIYGPLALSVTGILFIISTYMFVGSICNRNSLVISTFIFIILNGYDIEIPTILQLILIIACWWGIFVRFRRATLLEYKEK